MLFINCYTKLIFLLYFLALWSYVSAEVTTQREREHQRALMELELGALNTIYRVAKKELKEGKILEKKKWN